MNNKSAGRAVPNEDSWPGVSVILPILNEEKDLTVAVQKILRQEYAGPFEIVLAVGPSQDRTMEIANEIAAVDDRINVVENPSGATPAGLNIAIAAAKYDRSEEHTSELQSRGQ